MKIYTIKSFLYPISFCISMDAQERYFDSQAKHYGKISDDLPLFLSWNFRQIISRIKPGKGSKIVDLGTGTALLLYEIAKLNPNYEFIGFDISRKMLAGARKKFRDNNLKGKFIRSNLRQIPLKDDSVDYVVSNNALHHVKHKKECFSEIFRVLKKGGKLIFADVFEARDQKYDKIRSQLKKRLPHFSKAYAKSAVDTYDSMPVEADAKHPPEYHIPIHNLKILLEKIGFKKVKIIPTPYYFAIISAVK